MAEAACGEWTDACLVPDEVFAEAYGSLDGRRRAWLKQTVAQAHALVGPAADEGVTHSVDRRQGYRTLHAERPVRHAVMFLDSSCVSPVRVAAAAVPMVLCGARQVCAVCVGEQDAPPDAVLAALELAGLETVFRMNELDARRFATHLAESGSASVLFFGRGGEVSALAAAAGYASPPLKLWKPLPGDRLGVWAGAGGDWDWETLAWAHPCAALEVWGLRGAAPELPEACKRMRGGFEAFLAGGYPALYVPESRLREALGHAPLVLAPGQEGCWAWPELTLGFFRSERLAIGAWNG